MLREPSGRPNRSDARVVSLRKALEGLLDSLEATLRVQTWEGADAIPGPVSESASLLLVRLGAADRLLARSFSGAPSDTTRMEVMTAAVRRLDGAYVEFRKRITARPTERGLAATTLDAAVGEVKAGASDW